MANAAIGYACSMHAATLWEGFFSRLMTAHCIGRCRMHGM
jgi:hypothetical protein